jgi:hypothetical protein
MDKFPQAIRGFADVFALMQYKRHDADYNPGAQFTRSSVATDLQVVEVAMENFKVALLSDRRAFCAFVLFSVREEKPKQPRNKPKTSS